MLRLAAPSTLPIVAHNWASQRQAIQLPWISLASDNIKLPQTMHACMLQSSNLRKTPTSKAC
jgi:hypothetical protein